MKWTPGKPFVRGKGNSTARVPPKPALLLSSHLPCCMYKIHIHENILKAGHVIETSPKWQGGDSSSQTSPPLIYFINPFPPSFMLNLTTLRVKRAGTSCSPFPTEVMGLQNGVQFDLCHFPPPALSAAFPLTHSDSMAQGAVPVPTGMQ